MNYEASHTKIADDGTVKREIFKILLEGACTRRDLRWKLGLSGFKIGSKAVDYHLRRGKKGLINEGIVREDKKLLYPILDGASLPKVIRYLCLDPVVETKFNKDVSLAVLNAFMFLNLQDFLDLDIQENIERFERVIEDAKDGKVSDIEEVVKLILKAYQYDIFLDEISSNEDFLGGVIFNYASISPASAMFNKMRSKYENEASKRFWADLIEPLLAGGKSNLGIHITPLKRNLLRKIQDVSKILWLIENAHFDIVTGELTRKAERVFRKSARTVGLREKDKRYSWFPGL